MKMKDIHVGDDYLVCSAQKYPDEQWGLARVTVLGTRWEANRYSYRTREVEAVTGETVKTSATPAYEGQRCQGVLVLVRKEDGTPLHTTATVVTASQIRGPWDTEKANADAARAEQQRAAEQRRREREAAQEALEALRQRLRRQVPGAYLFQGSGGVTISTAVLVRLLDIIEGAE